MPFALKFAPVALMLLWLQFEKLEGAAAAHGQPAAMKYCWMVANAALKYYWMFANAVLENAAEMIHLQWNIAASTEVQKVARRGGSTRSACCNEVLLDGC